MAELIAGTTGQDVYPRALERIRLAGRRQDSRNGPVLNLDDVVIALDSPLNALPLGTGRNLNRKIAVAEALQLIGGFTDPTWMLKIAPQFEKYAERNPVSRELYFHGAYGPRVGAFAQLHVAVERLRSDPGTRQAVVTLWDAEADTESNHLDYPCTVALGFSVRNGQYLDVRTTMRSNDAWLGLPYDLFQFTQLQLSLCNVLDLLPGTYTHTAWSLHLYLENLESAAQVTPHCPQSGFQPRGIGLPGQDLNEIMARAYMIHEGLAPGYPVSDSERWYLDVLAA